MRLSTHPYPSILAAYQWCRIDRRLRSDYHATISIELELYNRDHPSHKVTRLHPSHLERLSYYWLAERQYHRLKTINY